MFKTFASILLILVISTSTFARWDGPSNTPPTPPSNDPASTQSESTSTSKSGALALAGSESEANAAALAAQAQKMKQKQKQAQVNLQATKTKSKSGVKSDISSTTDASSVTTIAIIEEAANIPVNTSAAVLPSECASGASGNSRRASFALSNSSSVCNSISLASAYQSLGEDEKAMAQLDKAASLNNAKANWCMFSKVITLGFWPCG